MRWKIKSPLVIGLVVISAIVVWKLGLLPANIYASECMRREGYTWDYDSNTCIPEPAFYCEQDGGIWDWEDEVCIPSGSDREEICPDGWEKDVWGVCMPIPSECPDGYTRTDWGACISVSPDEKLTVTTTVTEFPLMSSLLLVCLLSVLTVLFRKR